jgi:MFS transporter, DHA1 family, multidrug resistance protein
MLCMYTWVVCRVSYIYEPSKEDVVERFRINVEAAVLPLFIYTAAYRTGPVLFIPVGEIPAIGRNLVYYLTFIVLFILSYRKKML